MDAATAAGAAERLLARYGADLDLDPVRQRLLVDAYLVELWSRTWRLASAGWNAALHPALLSVLDHRLP